MKLPAGNILFSDLGLDDLLMSSLGMKLEGSVPDKYLKNLQISNDGKPAIGLGGKLGSVSMPLETPKKRGEIELTTVLHEGQFTFFEKVIHVW